MAVIPTEAGAYLDGGGDVWILSRNGQWIDCNGDRPPTMVDEAWQFLESNGPYTPMPRNVYVERQYRVRNDEQNFESEEYALLEEAKLWIDNDSDYIEERVSIIVPWTRVEESAESEEETPDEQE